MIRYTDEAVFVRRFTDEEIAGWRTRSARAVNRERYGARTRP